MIPKIPKKYTKFEVLSQKHMVTNQKEPKVFRENKNSRLMNILLILNQCKIKFEKKNYLIIHLKRKIKKI